MSDSTHAIIRECQKQFVEMEKHNFLVSAVMWRDIMVRAFRGEDEAKLLHEMDELTTKPNK